MTDSEQLSPDTINRVIIKEEAPLRRRAFASDTVNEIFRYGAFIGSVIKQHSRIPRGTESARQLILQAEETDISFHSGTVIIADEMLNSKGRFRRYWHAPKGGVWMTLAMVNTLLQESSLLLPMAAGVACCEVLRHYGIEAHIKWVNDTLVGKKKISGILTETFTGPRFGEEYILIGIGLNVNNDHFPADLSDTAVSMKTCLNKRISLQEVTALLLAKLRWNIGLLLYEEAGHLEKHGGIAVSSMQESGQAPGDEHLLLKSYKNLTDIFNRRVLFGFDVQKNPQFEAKIVGLDNTGGLILEMIDSSKIIQHSGEIIYLD